MTQHIMLDIETFGQAPNGVIISLGAVKFDPAETAFSDEFYVGIDTVGQTRLGRTFDADTINWWLQPEQRPALEIWSRSPQVHLAEALDGFTQWVGGDSFLVWGCSPTFDNTIVRNAIEACGIICPWHWRNDRDFRTLKALAPKNLEPGFMGTPHYALDDAAHQTRWLLKIAEHLNIAL